MNTINSTEVAEAIRDFAESFSGGESEAYSEAVVSTLEAVAKGEVLIFKKDGRIYFARGKQD